MINQLDAEFAIVIGYLRENGLEYSDSEGLRPVRAKRPRFGGGRVLDRLDAAAAKRARKAAKMMKGK